MTGIAEHFPTPAGAIRPPAAAMPKPRGKADPIDVHVGAAMRTRRKRVGCSQQSLAEHLGLTFQQVQKYEHGTNRCSASMLFRIAERLEVQVGYFFEGLAVAGPRPTEPAAPDNAVAQLLLTHGGADLALAFTSLPPHMRKAVLTISQALAASQEGGE